MNLIGKILTFVIFVLSLVFMTMVLVIYATHKNWREAVLNPPDKASVARPLGLKYVLKDEKEKAQRLKDELDKLTDEKNREVAAKTQALVKMKDEKDLLKSQVQKLQQSIGQLDEKQRVTVAALKATQEESAKFRGEVEGLRADTEKAQKDRDQHFREVVKLTDELHQKTNELAKLKSRNVSLSADLAKARKVLRHFDLNEDMDISGQPPRVDGLVLAVLGNGLVEISIGADSGLQKGHHLDIYRVGASGNKYVGRIEVLKTSPDKAVCKIDPKFQQSEVQKGDRVGSKLD
ncbi:MAG: hypothetical protein ACWGMZ_00995 [Thermoguttaceae bacterium]